MTRGSSPFDRDSSGSPDHDPRALDPDSRRPRPGRGAVGRLGGDGPRHRGRQPPPLSGAARAGPARERVGRRLARRSARRGRPVAARQDLRRARDDDRAPCRRQRSHAPQASLRLPVRLALRHRGRGALPGRCRARSRRPPRALPWRPAPALAAEGRLVGAPAHGGAALLRGSRRLSSDRAQGPTRRRARALRAARVGRGGVRGARRSAGRRACRGPERIHETQRGAGALTPVSRGAQGAL